MRGCDGAATRRARRRLATQAAAPAPAVRYVDRAAHASCGVAIQRSMTMRVEDVARRLPSNGYWAMSAIRRSRGRCARCTAPMAARQLRLDTSYKRPTE
jgi:hypothetical protein